MIIGLTGSIASGKSTVANMLKEMGFPIIDADLVARIVVEKGTATLEKIKETFGSGVIQEDGSLNREELGEIIFTNPSKRKLLNDIIHPAIRAEMLAQKGHLVQQGHPVIIMDIPLLFESRLQSFVDKILVVTVTEQTQLERLISRNGFTQEEAKLRIQSQLPLSVKEKGADAVIYNNGTIEETKQQLIKILAIWE
ncbi:dephospho-CoA kinase [Psychrobacillus psychrodurans]|jgi:dephospho-CoA kinase|uniref:dephospho-CoA kinase n=1 Tax=Psychrobacillus TaxID=1221880 RepID=UPI0008EA116B|nr:dephospho-CoA kinase [Psychrobacillus psychrodurans]MCK1996660.1 dephospho-CoA kinase [Psychrobacillus psychrodurans]MCZ8541763.1 dephospho-CoA kinase [Psychrobacillus psychrodurans]SFN01026.1 dephospho-CoA kinase [Psychrobacillus psychrodurans]